MPHEAIDPDWQTRPARGNDLAWLIHIGNKTCDANGFTPRAAIANHIERGDYTILDLRGQRAAFIFSSGGRRSPFRIVQSAVTLELWRQGYGEMLFRAVTLRALDRPVAGTTCSVREGLESNAFWRALGAIHVDTTPGGKTRRRQLLHYIWGTGALHKHQLTAATDPRHQLPERDAAARLLDAHGFLPHRPGQPRTPTADARHAAGIAIATHREPRQRANTPPPNLIDHTRAIPALPECPPQKGDDETPTPHRPTD